MNREHGTGPRPRRLFSPRYRRQACRRPWRAFPRSRRPAPHDAVAFGDAATARPVQTDRMHLVEKDLGLGVARDVVADGEGAMGTGALGVHAALGNHFAAKWASFYISQTSCNGAGPRGPAV